MTEISVMGAGWERKTEAAAVVGSGLSDYSMT